MDRVTEIEVSSNKNVKPPGRCSSELWHHFEKDHASGKAVCNICKEKLAYKSTTANLKSHLKRRHGFTFSSNAQAQIFVSVPEAEEEVVISSHEVDVSTPSFRNSTQKSRKRQKIKDSSGNKKMDASTPAAHSQSTDETSKSRKRQKIKDSYGNMKTDPSTPGPSQSSDETATSSKGQDTTDSCGSKKNRVQRKKQINSDLLDLCTDSFLPFSIVQERAFRKFCRWIPGYELPTRKTLSDPIMQEEYLKLDDAMQTQLHMQVPQSVCLSADMWTSVKTQHFIALTGHYITEDLNLKSMLLGCCHFTGQHTAENIAAEISALADKYELKDKVNFMISVDSANIVKAVKDVLGWKHFSCYARSLSLIVEKALHITKPQIDTVKQIVTQIKKSAFLSEMVQKYQVEQGREPKQLSQAMCAPWNSTYFMLKRFVELQDAIQSALTFADESRRVISQKDWTLYSQLCQILRPFAEICTSMGEEKYVTGSSVIIVTRCLKETCQNLLDRTDLLPQANETVLSLKSGLEERFKSIEKNETFALCTFMDPRFKMQGFSDQTEAVRTKERVRKLVGALIAEKDRTTVHSVTLANENNTNTDNLSPWNIFDNMVAVKPVSGTPTSKSIKEVNMYVQDDLLPRKDETGMLTCPLEWWRRHQYVYPNLKKIFVTRCNVVATSVPCDRMFTKAGHIINERRTRLTTSKIDQLMFLNVNGPENRFKGF